MPIENGKKKKADNGIVYPVERILWPPDIDEASFLVGRLAQSTL